MRTLGEVGAHMAYNTVLVGILIMYGLFGAFVFRKFEATERVSVSDGQPGISRDELLVDLWSGKDLDFDTWSVQAKNKLDLYEEGFNPESSISAEWSLDESWLFACTIFTTIGYGNITPMSTSGRIFCILYGFVGIPLFNVVAVSVGSLITGVIQFFHSTYEKRKRKIVAETHKKDDFDSEPLASEVNQEGNLTFKSVLSMTVAYLAAGTLLFSLWEDWSLFEAFYYCFVTLTTIGLGDYVPQNMHHTVFFGGYIIVGLVLVTMLFSAMEEEIAQWFDKIKRAAGITKHPQEDKKNL